LAEITRAFAAKVAEAEDIVAVEAITAVPLPEDLRERLLERIQEQTGRRVWLEERVDPAIVGGLVLNFGDSVVDASVRNNLDGLRRALTQAQVEVAAPSA
jgi:F-type H+-transporting ATPase subunit delta